MSPEKLVHMANEIARFMETRPEDEAVPGMADHLNDFWDPRMRRQFLAMVAAGEGNFRPLVLAAAPLVRLPA